MRILYLTQYFPPEIGATQTRAWEMARGLSRCGHRVTVLTEFPNHPAGVIPPSYRGKLVQREEVEGVEILRVWVKASPVKSFASRLAFYWSFMGMATFAGVFRARGKYDLLYATSPPLFAGAAAVAIRWLRRLPMVFEVRDLWPESAVQLGELHNPHARGLSEALERACYRAARHVVAVTRGIRDGLHARGIAAARVTLIPNGVNTELYRPRRRDPARRARLGLQPGSFVAVYAGLHGLVHGLETVLGAADRLRGVPGIVFLLVGDGPCKHDLVRRAGEMRLPNVIFGDPVPDAELPDLLAEADVGLDTRRRLDISRGTLPVKMFSYMACELPVILAIEGEAEELLREAGAGDVVAPESPGALAAAVLAMRDDPARRAECGRRGREFVKRKYSRDDLARRLATLLEEVAG